MRSCMENNADPDQLASLEASRSGSTWFSNNEHCDDDEISFFLSFQLCHDFT